MQLATIAYTINGGPIRHIKINTPTWLGVPFAVAYATNIIKKFHNVPRQAVTIIKSI